MGDIDASSLEVAEAAIVNTVLKDFVDKNIQNFTFCNLNLENKRQKLWAAIFHHLGNEDESSCHKLCLSAIRVLSRDRTDLNQLITEERLDVILHHSALLQETQINEDMDCSIVLEALKCLCNIIFNSSTAQEFSVYNHTVDGVLLRLRTYRDLALPQEIKLFDMKLLFLVTALSAEVRPRLKSELHGLTYLMETLDLILKEVNGHSLSDNQVVLSSEVLKVLFNLTVKSNEGDDDEEEETALFLRLVSILHDLLLCKTDSADKKNDLTSHIVNLLMSIPHNCYQELTTPLQEQFTSHIEFHGRNMEVIGVLLDFLDNRLDHTSEGIKYHLESLSPILTVLLGCVRSQSLVRKWLRIQILPPLTEVLGRPEEGSTLRNKLCRHLTSPVTPVRDLTADLLFVLCKENVVRMVKYTGYGNAAGLLASRGLMLGGNVTNSPNNFSSDSEDSDTEEYKKCRNQINPVTGRVEPLHDNSQLAAMTDEQKEYEAMRLVNMMDKLARDGIVQPCRINQDGRPEPVDHILQMIQDSTDN